MADVSMGLCQSCLKATSLAEMLMGGLCFQCEIMKREIEALNSRLLELTIQDIEEKQTTNISRRRIKFYV